MLIEVDFMGIMYLPGGNKRIINLCSKFRASLICTEQGISASCSFGSHKHTHLLMSFHVAKYFAYLIVVKLAHSIICRLK